MPSRKEAVTVYLPVDVKTAIAELAVLRATSMNRIINDCLADQLGLRSRSSEAQADE